MNDTDYQAHADILGDPGRGLDVTPLPPTVTRDQARQLLRQEHERDMDDLRRMLDVHALHQSEQCGDPELCSGSALFDWLLMRCRTDRGWPLGMIRTLVAEVARLRGQVGNLETRAMSIDMDLVNALGELADVRAELEQKRAQLTACDEFPPDAVVWPEGRSD